MNQITQNVLNTISEQHVTPKARWQFVLRRSVWWLLFGLSTIVGSVAVAISLFVGRFDVGYVLAEPPGGVRSALAAIPVVWVVILGVGVAFAYLNMRHTSGGYRYRWYGVIAASVGASVILGVVLFAIGAAGRVEEVMYRQVRPYQQFEDFRRAALTEPQHGRLVGVITDQQEGYFELRDVTGHGWTVSVNSQTDWPPEWLNRPWPPMPRVMVIGTAVSEREFTAEMVRPLLRPAPELHQRLREIKIPEVRIKK